MESKQHSRRPIKDSTLLEGPKFFSAESQKEKIMICCETPLYHTGYAKVGLQILYSISPGPNDVYCYHMYLRPFTQLPPEATSLLELIPAKHISSDWDENSPQDDYFGKRNIDEALRMVDALQFFEEHGEVCPANWNPGDDAMVADAAGVAKYLSEH